MTRKSTQKSWISLAAAALTLALTVTPAWADYQELEGIVAVVEDDVILASELQVRIQQILQQLSESNINPPSNNVLVSQVMERLIIENLQRQEARRRGVEIDDETLTRSVQEFAASNQMTLEQFQAALERDGVSYREFREDIRSELMISRLQRNVINRRITISPQDIESILASPWFQDQVADEYRVRHIMLSIEDGAGDAVVERAMTKAEELIAEARDGADFAELALANSAASTSLNGGDLGWRRAVDLPSLFAEDILSMEVGQVSDPIVRPGAIHIVKLDEQRGTSMQTLDQTNVRHILITETVVRDREQAKALIEDLAQQLRDGADFAELAKEHSEDPGTALTGGGLGWSSADQFVGAFAETMNNTPIGEISEPFRSQFGWHVLEVLDRRQEDMSDETRERMAAEVLHRRRFEEEQQEWLKELRDEAFVEVRLSGSG